MPKSKSKRDNYTPPPKPNPPPSPTWVPILGTALIGLGVLVILLNYMTNGTLPLGNYLIIVGFVMMAGGLGFLSQWR